MIYGDVNIIDSSSDELSMSFPAEGNVESYEGYKNLPCNFVGSIALYQKAVLQEAAAARGITIGNIIQNPMEGLVKYHAN